MSTRAIHRVNENADVISSRYALNVNITAARSLQQILKTNLGPKGTLKMLVGGAGSLKLTKDGAVLLKQMQIQHPTAALIARTASAQDHATGDGTTSCVLLTAELLRQAESYIQEGVHPRVIVDGYELAREEALNFAENYKYETDKGVDREHLLNVARTSLRTKLHAEMADHLTEICTDAVMSIHEEGKPIDLHMIEIQTMRHRLDLDTRLVRGLVLDHGTRHPNMRKRATNCKILFMNINLEWEHTEVNSAFYYKDANQREDMAKAERQFVNNRVQKIIDFKNEVLKDGEQMVLINVGGLDPICLEMLQKADIMGIRRAKRRNMERLAKSCGGYCVNTENGLKADCLGFAESVYEHCLGDDKYTFIEGVPFSQSVTVLIKGPNNHTIAQIKDALRDGLRAVKNAIEQKCVMPGAGAFEIACCRHLREFKKTVKGRAKLGVQAMSDALLIVPKTLASNSGLDPQDSIIKLMDAHQDSATAGLDLETGEILDPIAAGILDLHSVKKQLIQLATVISTKILLVDQIIRAGRRMKKN